MNYYKRHLGDYAKDTGHLTMLEHGAYTLLLDRYYSTERAIPASDAYRVCRARSKEERQAVDSVLAEFFRETDGVWLHPRCDAEIGKATKQAEQSREVGKKGGRPKKSETRKEPAENPPGFENEPAQNLTPLLHNSNSVSIETDADGVGRSSAKPPSPPRPPDDPAETIFGYGVPLLVASGVTDKAARSFLGGLRKAHGDEAVVEKLRACVVAKPLQPVEWLAAALPPAGRAPAKRVRELVL